MKLLILLEDIKNLFYLSFLFRCDVGVFRQFSPFHTFGQLNRPDGKIHKEFDHYANDRKSDGIPKLLVQLGQQGRIDDAIAMYEKLGQAQRQDDCVKLTMINILVQADRLSAAKQLIINEKIANEPATTTTPASLQANTILCSLFNRLVRQLDFDDLNIFIENLIFSRKYVSRTVLEIILNDLLTKNADFDQVLSIFERMAKRFRETPLFQSIACALINRGDTERLEQILAISTKVHGRINSLYSMAFALNACNRTDQAEKIFSSLGIERESERLEQCIDHLRMRRQSTLLENLLVSTKQCVPLQYREQMCVALLELYAYQGASDDITRTCSTMNAEQIMPTGQTLERLVQIFRRNNISVPNSWQSIGDAGASGDDLSETQLKSLLDANSIDAANDMILKLLEAEKSLSRTLIKYCLLKNAEHANTKMFQHLTAKLDSNTKIHLNFPHHECSAYLNAKKCQEYLQMVHDAAKQNQNDLRTVAAQLPDNIIQLIDTSTDIYDQCKYSKCANFSYFAAMNDFRLLTFCCLFFNPQI